MARWDSRLVKMENGIMELADLCVGTAMDDRVQKLEIIGAELKEFGSKKLNDTIQRIIQTSRKTVKFCWVPSHRNIAGNERANSAAGRARGELNSSITHAK